MDDDDGEGCKSIEDADKTLLLWESESSDHTVRVFSFLFNPHIGYMKYASQVRQEYIHVPHDVYCSKRAEVLTSFLAHSRIYASTYYHDKLEARARSNIATEIEMLWKGIIPHQESHQGS